MNYFLMPGLKKELMYNITLNAENIIEVVTGFFGISFETIRGKGRKHETVLPRQITMYFLRRNTPMTLRSIGVLFDGRDHTTIIHSVQTVEDLIATDPIVDKNVYDIFKILVSKAIPDA